MFVSSTLAAQLTGNPEAGFEGIDPSFFGGEEGGSDYPGLIVPIGNHPPNMVTTITPIRSSGSLTNLFPLENHRTGVAAAKFKVDDNEEGNDNER